MGLAQKGSPEIRMPKTYPYLEVGDLMVSTPSTFAWWEIGKASDNKICKVNSTQLACEEIGGGTKMSDRSLLLSTPQRDAQVRANSPAVLGCNVVPSLDVEIP